MVLFDLLVNDLEELIFPLLGVHFLLMRFDVRRNGVKIGLVMVYSSRLLSDMMVAATLRII